MLAQSVNEIPLDEILLVLRVLLLHIGPLLLLLGIAFPLGKKLSTSIVRKKDSPLIRRLSILGPSITYTALVSLYLLVFRPEAGVAEVGLMMGLVWILTTFLFSFSRNRTVARLLSGLILLIALLHFSGFLAPIEERLSAIHIIPGKEITVMTVLSGIIAFTFAIYISLTLSRLLEERISKQQDFSPSLRVLLAKIIRVVALAVAFFIAIDAIGLDLTILAAVGGGLGIGLGFGLQKVVSNFISGFILLCDRSIKPGDVIEIEQTYGWINELQARYVSIITRDGTEHLIPNEDLITQRVINWSHSDNLVRLKVGIGISYNSDLHKAIALVKEACKVNERILQEPAPNCLVKEFDDSSINLEARFWINDPNNGVSNIKSTVMLKIWDLFAENGIQIPFPQRDLHLKSSEPVQIMLNRNSLSKAEPDKKTES